MTNNKFITITVCFTFLLGLSLHGAAQTNTKQKEINIIWEGETAKLDDPSINDNEQLTILSDENGQKVVFQFPIANNSIIKYSIKNFKWLAQAGQKDNLTNENATTVIASKKHFGVIEFPISTKNLNQFNKITSFTIQYSEIRNSRPLETNRRYVANSALRTGNWYQFAIPETGMYKLSYEFLQSLGIDVGNTSINSYSVFGQNGGMLPKLAGDPRIDDIEEIAIDVKASSTTLQPGDYLIFYGEGPDKVSYNAGLNRFEHENHLYADAKTYYITTNQGNGKRVNLTNAPTGTPDASYNTFDDFDYVEDDFVNLNKSGSDWYGDEFGITLNRSYTFDFNNINSSKQATLAYRLISRASSTASFELNHNTNNIVTRNISGVDLDNYLGPVGIDNEGANQFPVSGNEVKIDVVYNQPNFSAQGWLDYLAINVSRNLVFSNNQMQFQVIDSRQQNLVEYQLSNLNSNVSIWDITNLFDLKAINYQLNGSTATFLANGGQLNKYVAFIDADKSPIAIGPISNQDLHGLADADMLIITRPSMVNQANEIAQIHVNNDNLTSHIVTMESIFNEFSSGTNDVTAIRDFIKYFYDRNNNYPDYVLLLGDGTFNNKALGNFDLPTFQYKESLSTLGTYVTDDFFAFLDDTEGDNVNGNSNRLDVAIGRIPADNSSKANIAVQKIRTYYDKASFGNWRNVGTYVADDEDSNLHLRHAEENSNAFIQNNPKMNIDKIYLDAFNQVAGSGGGSYPSVNEAINKRIFKGTLFLNYIGHGGTNGLAEEGVITLNDIASWDNPEKLTLIVSATCEFTRYDDFNIYSAGERAFFKSDGGAIALVTTVRVVFASENKNMNISFMNSMTEAARDPNMRLGDISKESKNNSATQDDGNRKFTLIGDPALRLAFPLNNVQTTAINGAPYIFVNDTLQTDTLKALNKVTIDGVVQDRNNQLLSDFNGFVYPTVYDKLRELETLGNDEGSSIAPFNVQNNIIYAGKVQAINGQFSFTFVVPKDINYTLGEGKISYYAHNDDYDASGVDTVIVGGGGNLDSNSIDNDGPVVEVFMDDESWISGDFTDDSPDLLVKLFDENGINTVGSGIGHDIVAVLDEDNQNSITLNDFYESELNSFQRGTILYPLELIPVGTHDIKVKAWDVYNNSGDGFTEFVVADNADLALEHVLNYPNPFTTNTNFIFEHNRKGDLLDVRIEIFSVSGKLVKTIQENIASDSRRVEIPWDGLDEYGDKIGKGVYIYKVVLKDSSGEKTDQFQKLVLLR